MESKMEKNTGLFKTHGDLAGEKLDHLRSAEELTTLL
jgi:hypothetical protein